MFKFIFFLKLNTSSYKIIFKKVSGNAASQTVAMPFLLNSLPRDL